MNLMTRYGIKKSMLQHALQLCRISLCYTSSGHRLGVPICANLVQQIEACTCSFASSPWSFPWFQRRWCLCCTCCRGDALGTDSRWACDALWGLCLYAPARDQWCFFRGGNSMKFECFHGWTSSVTTFSRLTWKKTVLQNKCHSQLVQKSDGTWWNLNWLVISCSFPWKDTLW